MSEAGRVLTDGDEVWLADMGDLFDRDKDRWCDVTAEFIIRLLRRAATTPARTEP